MNYLAQTVYLKHLIKEANEWLLDNMQTLNESPNMMFVKLPNQGVQKKKMGAFSNEFVFKALAENKAPEAFVITDLATMNVEGKELTYLLYKGYHAKVNQGFVFYQVIDTDTLHPIGKLQFSNMEENIFHSVEVPKGEESSCNAMETDKKIKDGKSIVFFIGHMNEERLVYDIERLIIDTVHNVSKHPKLNFSFIVSISKYGGTPSDELIKTVQAIKSYTQKNVVTEYTNTKFEFTFEKDDSQN